MIIDHSDFGQFWNLYPRKHGRGFAVSYWLTMKPDQRKAALEALPNHIRYWTLTSRSKDMIPKPENWLKAWSWEDEIDTTEEIPVKAVAWWASEAGILERGRELGLHAKGGESMQEFKARVVEAARRAA